ncbi:MAG: DoxX family protein [Aequorivita sp.]
MCSLARKTSITNTTITVICYLFVLLFLYAATSKLLDFETFTVQLAQSPLLSAYAGIIAWMVPGIEILIAVLLIFPRFRNLALYASFTLMVMFTAYIYIILNFSDFIPCSCGGVLEKLSWTQHLIFNVVFIVLAGGAILISIHWNIKRRLLLLLILAIIGIGIVAILFAFSEKKMHRNNAFQRRYIPHPIEKIHSLDLEYSSYYFAGIGNGKVYLGNTTAPLLMTVIDSSLTDTTTTMIQLDQMDLPYRGVKVWVVPPIFYVTDGTVPIILQGDVADWNATTKMQGDYYFNHSYPINSNKIAVQSSSSVNRENILGIIDIGDSLKGTFSNQLLIKQLDGIFDTDGRLIYNVNLDRLIFTYYYRNEYMVISLDLKLKNRGRTIDTVSKAHIHITENSSQGQRKLGGNTIVVNKNITTIDDLLLIESPRLGNLEPENMIKEANIIDVYNLTDQSYRFSFYLYKHENSKAREFMIKDGKLYALQDNYLVAYKLTNIHFE